MRMIIIFSRDVFSHPHTFSRKFFIIFKVRSHVQSRTRSGLAEIKLQKFFFPSPTNHVDTSHIPQHDGRASLVIGPRRSRVNNHHDLSRQAARRRRFGPHACHAVFSMCERRWAAGENNFKHVIESRNLMTQRSRTQLYMAIMVLRMILFWWKVNRAKITMRKCIKISRYTIDEK